MYRVDYDERNGVALVVDEDYGQERTDGRVTYIYLPPPLARVSEAHGRSRQMAMAIARRLCQLVNEHGLDGG